MIDDAYADRKTIEPWPTTETSGPDENQPMEPDVEMPLRRSQLIGRHGPSDYYAYLHGNDFFHGSSQWP